MQGFNEIAQYMRLPIKKEFTLDIATRWNSTYKMLTHTITYKDVFNRYASEHSRICPTNDEWKQADVILKFLEGFLDATKVFSDYKYPTSNFYVKEVWKIMALLMHGSVDTNDTLKQLINEM